MQDLSKHNSIKPCACPELRALFLEEESLEKVLLEFQSKLQNKDVFPRAKVLLGLERETNSGWGMLSAGKP